MMKQREDESRTKENKEHKERANERNQEIRGERKEGRIAERNNHTQKEEREK